MVLVAVAVADGDAGFVDRSGDRVAGLLRGSSVQAALAPRTAAMQVAAAVCLRIPLIGPYSDGLPSVAASTDVDLWITLRIHP